MERITEFNFRKIAYLVLLLLEISFLIIATFLKSPTHGFFLWQMIMMSSKVGTDASIGSYIIIFFTCVIILTFLISISHILNKKDNSYFGSLAFITVLMIICLIVNKVTKTLETGSVVLICLALAINIISSIYSFICIKFNKELEEFEANAKKEE